MNPTDEALVERVTAEIKRSAALLRPNELAVLVEGVMRAALSAVPEKDRGVEVVVKLLEWGKPAPPDEDCRYDHVTATTAFGEISIEWKSWKPHDSFVVYNDGNYLTSERTIDAAKAVAQADYEARIRSALLPASGAVASGGVEAVAWRWRHRSSIDWTYGASPEIARRDLANGWHIDLEPLYLSVSTPPEAEAAIRAEEREVAISDFASQIGIALRDYDDNLSYGADAQGPEYFIECGMERAAAAIRARGQS